MPVDLRRSACYLEFLPDRPLIIRLISIPPAISNPAPAAAVVKQTPSLTEASYPKKTRVCTAEDSLRRSMIQKLALLRFIT
jgi:hypothetical protein